MNPFVLVLYYSRIGGTKNLALHIARGVDEVDGIDVRIRTVPEVSTNIERTAPPIPDEGAIYCEKEDLADCAGLALGSATRFGNMAAPLKHFLEDCTDLWMARRLVDKPAAVFGSSNSLHGGQESTLLSMMIPLFHQGMIIQSLPYSEAALNETETGGTPYGVTHFAPHTQYTGLSDEEIALCEAQGQRIAELAIKLKKR